MIIKDCFENLEIGGHSLQGIKLQIDGNRPEKIIERAKSIKYIIGESNNHIVGIGGYDDLKIHTLFVSRQLHGSGIGKIILNEIIYRAKIDRIKCLTTWSTIYAQGFYTKNGFETIKDVYMPEDTKDIQLIEMKRFI